MKNLFFTVVVALLSLPTLIAQTIVPIPFGDMENWQKRLVKESFVIGGDTKTLYELSRGKTIREKTPFVNRSSDWATSSVYARVSGVTKGSVTVFPERRTDGRGTAARLETKLEKVKVLGIINISALATGSIFLGSINEPIRDTKNPMAKLMQGILFTECPSFLQFDYKFINGNNGVRIKATGFSSDDNIPGRNAAEVNLLLQKRWEDDQGNVYARRIATGWKRYTEDVAEWVNDERIDILYGDISKHENFEPYMGLLCDNPIYTRNSKGEIKPIQEVGWASEGEKPTHIVLKFSSGYGGAYVGAPGSKLWVDNIALGYDN